MDFSNTCGTPVIDPNTKGNAVPCPLPQGHTGPCGTMHRPPPGEQPKKN